MNRQGDHSREIDETSFQALLKETGRVPLQQSFAYGQAMEAAGRLVRRFKAGPDHVAQAAARRLPGGAGLVLLARGPLPIAGDLLPVRDQLYRSVRASLGRSLLLWSPMQPAAGLVRPVVTGYATVWIDLRPDHVQLRRRLDGKWRNQLARAEAQGLQVRQVHGGPAVRWLAQRHDIHRREVGYRALPVPFLERMAQASPGCRDRLVLVAACKGVPVAGIWLQVHHGSATYLIGYADAVGRRTDAMRLLLWQGMLALRERGVQWLDLGGVATDRAPGLSRFKFGMGGTVDVEAGTYFRPLLA